MLIAATMWHAAVFLVGIPRALAEDALRLWIDDARLGLLGVLTPFWIEASAVTGMLLTFAC